MSAEISPFPESTTPPPVPPDRGTSSEVTPVPEDGPTWEDDETPATGVFRATFTIFAGALLLWSQWNTPYQPSAQFWSRWVETAVVFNFLIPLFLVWMFYGQGLTHQDWLKDQKHNGWNYGWNWTHWKRHALWALGALLVMLPFLVFFAQNKGVRASYSTYYPPVEGATAWLWFMGSLVVYMVSWEWFFRGFGLFSIAQGFGPIAAILIQAVGFGLAHYGKPPVEMASSFAGGALLGYWCWREKSFVPAFFTHTLIQCVWAVLIKTGPLW